MLKEFAVDPKTIVSSFETCRFLVHQFGADKGRVISKFPKNWKRLAIDAAGELPDGFRKERVFEYLNSINNEWLTLLPSKRRYDALGKDWISNALSAHKENPFAAIICDRDDTSSQMINAETFDPDGELFFTKKMDAVSRTAESLSLVAAPLLQNCRKLRLVDPHFKPGRQKWKDGLAAMLAYIPDITKVECEYHIHEGDDAPTTSFLKKQLQCWGDVIPVGGSLKIIRWKEKPGGERVHRRYLLIENAGLFYEGGLDPEVGAEQTTDVGLMERDLHARRWSEYDISSEVYELVQPILVVGDSGDVTEKRT